MSDRADLQHGLAVRDRADLPHGLAVRDRADLNHGLAVRDRADLKHGHGHDPSSLFQGWPAWIWSRSRFNRAVTKPFTPS